jgi:hypothetical protein
MWAIATRSPLRLVVARAMASRSQSRTNAGEAPGKPRLGFDFGQQGGELVELDDRATHASPPSSSARGCVTMANCSLPSVVALTVVCECKALISLDDGTPGKITIASAGVGSAGHLIGEFFKLTAGVDLVHVPYRGAGPALTDLLGGQVMMSFAGIAGSIEYIRTGKLRALAVTTATRSEALPDVPTVGEFVPGFEAGDWLGIGAPRNTPAEIINQLNKETAAALADPKIKARFADLGGTALALTPAEFGKLIADETEKWAKVIRAANIKPE